MSGKLWSYSLFLAFYKLPDKVMTSDKQRLKLLDFGLLSVIMDLSTIWPWSKCPWYTDSDWFFIGYRLLRFHLGFWSERIFSKTKEINELAASRHFPTFLDPILKIEFHFLKHFKNCFSRERDRYFNFFAGSKYFYFSKSWERIITENYDCWNKVEFRVDW